MRSVSDKFIEKIKTHILCSVTVFENRAVYEIMWKNIVERGRPQMTVWHMRIACQTPKVTNTHTLNLGNTHCFPTATMVVRKRLNVTLYVHCLSCYVLFVSM